MNPGCFRRTNIVLSTIVVSALLVTLSFTPSIHAQQANLVTTTNQSQAALELEMTNAYQRVLQIVNKPVRAFAKSPNMDVSVFSPGWFHEGASKPDFNTVDIRQSQQLIYAKNKYVTSDLNPKIVFLGAELEFNAMTKLFYTNRSLPKRKLTEAEMLEINELYRVIGKCERALLRINNPIPNRDSISQAETEEAETEQPLADIRSIPQETRIFYGAIGVGGLIVVMVIIRLFRKKA
jgi:hypothetical protein